MSGTEAAYTYDDWNLNPNDLNEFIQSGYKDAAILSRGIKSLVNPQDDGTRKQVGDIFYDKNFKALSADESKKAATAFAEFNNWKDRRAKTNKDYLDYSNLSKSKPGRDATILTPLSGPEGKTVIGSYAAKKTVLG